MTLDDQRQYRLGVAFGAISALAWSSSGLFIRHIGADLMTMLFWRGLFSGTCVFLVFVYLERGRVLSILRRMGWPSVWTMIFSATSMITGIGSMYYTAIADAMVIYATVPFVTAALAFVFIGERPSRSTLVASGVALVGVLVMLTDGHGEGGGLFGKFLAAIMTLSVAAMATLMRKHRDVPMLPAMAGSAWLCSLVTFWFAAPLTVSAVDLKLIIVFAIVQNAMGLIFYTASTRRLPAADASLLTALEVPLTPLWVWLVLNEVPSPATLIGGPIVLAALFGHIVYEVQRNRATSSHPPL
ncbi:drug/metabolite transporter (DMT)-like permease [Peteryoungia aggregata LMG 23059]|uniref:Drug/metabolite transporter (DMT)-like permease n=1 Tax=Peteryoungia aggregata LMG 23059 TaxID=1368425 RepID=A0ABU0G9M1_9HYPH|nr:DMT family transporter [Peteryoungia aggregata]MDQ0422054.1 drug/metabolite transporter (DMT)-like permease [Peteryoungia aggregata LMG 23059]